MQRLQPQQPPCAACSVNHQQPGRRPRALLAARGSAASAGRHTHLQAAAGPPCAALAPAPTCTAAAPAGRRRASTTTAAAAKAAAAGVAGVVGGSGAASFPALQAALAPVLPYVMAAAAACCLALVALMMLAPGAQLTQRSVRSNLPLVLLSLGYGAVLLASWSPDTLHLMMPGSLEEGLKDGFNPQFFPTLQSVQALFGRPFTAASFLLHAAAINLIAARSAYLDGLAARVPAAHSVLLAAVVGPLGLLSHALTKGVYAALGALLGRDVRPAARPVLERSQQGTITIMPYDGSSTAQQ